MISIHWPPFVLPYAMQGKADVKADVTLLFFQLLSPGIAPLFNITGNNLAYVNRIKAIRFVGIIQPDSISSNSHARSDKRSSQTRFHRSPLSQKTTTRLYQDTFVKSIVWLLSIQKPLKYYMYRKLLPLKQDYFFTSNDYWVIIIFCYNH